MAADPLDILERLEAEAAIHTALNDPAQIDQFVTAVSRCIDDLCGPVVQREVTETLEAMGGVLIPTYSPVASVSSLIEYKSGAGTVLTGETVTTAGGYRLRNGLLYRRSSFYDIVWCGPAEVTYVAGRYTSTAEVDAKFKLAAAEILAREWPQYAAAWARGGDGFAAAEGGIGYFRSVQPVVDQWLAFERRVPAVG